MSEKYPLVDMRAKGENGATRTPLVRHRPQHETNALADYIQQSLESHNAQEVAESATRRRRQRPRKKTTNAPKPLVVCVRGLVEVDELVDDDEYNDIVTDLQSELERFGTVVALDVNRTTGESTVQFSNPADALAFVEAKNGQLYGGRAVTTMLQSTEKKMDSVVNSIVQEINHLPSKPKRKRRSKIQNAVLRAQLDENTHNEQRVFMVRNMIETDEVEDEDEYEEVMRDVTDVFMRHGTIVKVIVCRDGQAGAEHQAGDVVVEYVDGKSARIAFNALQDSKYGGRTLVCSWIESPRQDKGTVSIHGMVEPDELEDDDEYKDVCDELKSFFSAIVGEVKGVVVARDSGLVTLDYENQSTASLAVEILTRITYGGKKLLPRLHESREKGEAQPPPMMEGKGPNLPSVQVSEAMVNLLTVFLQRLASLQERSHIQNPLYDKRSRRLVLGLHEVRRGLQSHKIKLLILASDFDTCDVLDEKLNEIITIATREKVPIVRALNRRKLGKILKKHARVSCIGVYSYDGANDQYREIVRELELLEQRTSLKE